MSRQLKRMKVYERILLVFCMLPYFIRAQETHAESRNFDVNYGTTAPMGFNGAFGLGNTFNAYPPYNTYNTDFAVSATQSYNQMQYGTNAGLHNYASGFIGARSYRSPYGISGGLSSAALNANIYGGGYDGVFDGNNNIGTGSGYTNPAYAGNGFSAGVYTGSAQFGLGRSLYPSAVNSLSGYSSGFGGANRYSNYAPSMLLNQGEIYTGGYAIPNQHPIPMMTAGVTNGIDAFKTGTFGGYSGGNFGTGGVGGYGGYGGYAVLPFK